MSNKKKNCHAHNHPWYCYIKVCTFPVIGYWKERNKERKKNRVDV